MWRVFGIPKIATSDQGPQFILTFINELCKLTKVKQKILIIYHPQTDGNTKIYNYYIN